MTERSGITERLAGLFGKASASEDIIWQDREIRFDLAKQELECRKGEFIIDRLEAVEDTKGGNGDLGKMLITNLRLLWVSNKNQRTNICLGYNCVSTVTIKTGGSRLRGSSQALYVLTRFNGARFEFIFTSMQGSYPKLFLNLQSVHEAYDSSRMYRELKLRAALIEDKELRLLPREEIYTKINGVWNLSSDQGNLGTFYVTNVRVVWHANMAENFNISMPFMQIKSTKVRDSKFGTALVIETSPQSGGYILGFRIDPKEQMIEAQQEISALWQIYSQNPIFGVEFAAEGRGMAGSDREGAGEEDVEIVDVEDKGDIFATYYAEGAKSMDRPPVFCPELGLAVESLRDGFSIEQFWKVL